MTVRSEIQNGFLRLEFMDYGDGVPEEELPKLFQKFYRGSNSQAGSKNGSGLGLYIAHHLMHEMKGDIQYYNRPDGFSVEVLIRLA
ncbi:MAG: sensor histidine kinase [Hungatella hathewayi]